MYLYLTYVQYEYVHIRIVLSYERAGTKWYVLHTCWALGLILFPYDPN
jgi:hypothetical protein